MGWCIQQTEPKFQGSPREAHEKNQKWCVITFALESNERSWIFLQEQLGFSPLGHSLGWHDYFQVFSHHLWEVLIVFGEFILKLKKLVFLSILEWIMPKLLQGSKWTLVFFRLYCVSGRKVYAKDRAKFQSSPREAHGKGQNWCATPFGLWGPMSEVWFFSKSSQGFLPSDIG